MISFIWSAISGYVSHEITPPHRVPDIEITHKKIIKKVIKKIPKNVKAVQNSMSRSRETNDSILRRMLKDRIKGR